MDLLQVCKELIAIPSISGEMEAIEKVLAYCQQLFKPSDAIVKVFRWPGVSPVLYISNNQSKINKGICVKIKNPAVYIK